MLIFADCSPWRWARSFLITSAASRCPVHWNKRADQDTLSDGDEHVERYPPSERENHTILGTAKRDNYWQTEQGPYQVQTVAFDSTCTFMTAYCFIVESSSQLSNQLNYLPLLELYATRSVCSSIPCWNWGEGLWWGWNPPATTVQVVLQGVWSQAWTHCKLAQNMQLLSKILKYSYPVYCSIIVHPRKQALEKSSQLTS